MAEKMSYDEAKKRVEDIRGFFWHLFAYVIVNVFMLAMNWLTAPGHWWSIWIVVLWGVGLAFHGASVFIENGPLGKTWERRKIRELMGEDERGERRP